MPYSAKQHRSPANKPRPHAAARGYDKCWQKFREHYLAHNPLCVDCLQQGRVNGEELEIHHIHKLEHRPDLKYEWQNLMALCKACHSKRTRRGE